MSCYHCNVTLLKINRYGWLEGKHAQTHTHSLTHSSRERETRTHEYIRDEIREKISSHAKYYMFSRTHTHVMIMAYSVIHQVYPAEMYVYRLDDLGSCVCYLISFESLSLAQPPYHSHSVQAII